MHGHAEHEGGLFQLSPYLPLDRTIVAPRGALETGAGYSWFDINAPRPAAINAAADEFADWLARVSDTATSVALLGFSQGGILAIQVMRRHPELVDAVVMLSGLYDPKPDPGDAALEERKPPLFWGRGTADELIPGFGIDLTRDWLVKHTTLTERIYEDLGHAISDAELDEVNSFLRSHTPG